MKELLRAVIAHILCLAAEIVNVIPLQNESVLQEEITRKKQFLEKDIKL